MELSTDIIRKATTDAEHGAGIKVAADLNGLSFAETTDAFNKISALNCLDRKSDHNLPKLFVEHIKDAAGQYDDMALEIHPAGIAPDNFMLAEIKIDLVNNVIVMQGAKSAYEAFNR